MNSQAVESVMRHSTMSGTKRMILIAIAKHMNYGTGLAFPSINTIADLAGCSSKQVARLLPEIAKSGELEIIGGYGTGKKQQYRILLPMENLESYTTNQETKAPNGKTDDAKMSEIEALIDTKMSAFADEIDKKFRTFVNEISDILVKISDISEKKADIFVHIEDNKKEDKEEVASNDAQPLFLDNEIQPIETDIHDEKPNETQPLKIDSSHPAIKAVRHIQKAYPSKRVWDSIARSLGENVDMEVLVYVSDMWNLSTTQDGKPYNPSNVNGKLEWYKQAMESPFPMEWKPYNKQKNNQPSWTAPANTGWTSSGVN